MKGINRVTALLLALLLCLVTLPACKSQPTGTVYTSTDFTPSPGDYIWQVSGLMVQMTLDDLIQSADTIITGRVVEIREPRWTNEHSDPRSIYMDVIIKPERFLLGFEADKIAVRVLGGRIGATSMIVEDQPEFTLGQQVLLFLSHPVNLDLWLPEGLGFADYYNVTGNLQGMWAYNNGKAADFNGAVHDLASIERRIAELRPGEQVPGKFVRPAHEGTPLVFFERNYLMGGKGAQLSIFDEGTVILREDIGTRMAINGFTRCWFAGKLSTKKLTEIKAYINSSGFLGLPEHYVYQSMTFADLGITIETNIGDVTKKVTSMGYFADSLPDIFGDVYDTLIAITYDLKLVGSEKIT
jgi:hypothetical protein